MQRISAFNDSAFASYMTPPSRAAPPPQPTYAPPPQPAYAPPPQPTYAPEQSIGLQDTAYAAQQLQQSLAYLQRDVAQLRQQIRSTAVLPAQPAPSAPPILSSLPQWPQWTQMALFVILLLVFGLFIMGIVITTRVNNN